MTAARMSLLEKIEMWKAKLSDFGSLI